MSDEILRELAAILEARKQADPDSSYVARLYAKGLDAILKKVGEEAAETLLAAKNGDPEPLVRETAAELGKTVAILLDTKGPGIRTHKFSGGSALLQEGEYIEVVSGAAEILGSSERFSTTYTRLHLDLRPGSKVLIDDGLIELDSNIVERAIRPQTITRKNSLFAGSDGGGAHGPPSPPSCRPAR